MQYVEILSLFSPEFTLCWFQVTISNPGLSPYSLLAPCKKRLNNPNQHLQRYRDSKISCRGRCVPRVCASAHNSKSLSLILELSLSCILFSIKKGAPSRFLQNPKEKTANDLSMLLANLSKSPSLERLLDLRRAKVPALSSSSSALGQLIDLFNLGSKYNSSATFDYLAYVFADLAKVNIPHPFFYGLYSLNLGLKQPNHKTNLKFLAGLLRYIPD